MSKSRDIADSAATINYIDNVTSDVQSQINTLDNALDNISVTSGTLTKTFTTGESSTINLSSSVLAPVVSVTKEVPQSGVTNNSWDVNSTTENYTRLDSAYDTTLDFVAAVPTTPSISYTGNSFNYNSQDTNAREVQFKDDGTKMYVFGGANARVYQYSLSTAWDVSTATYDSVSLDVFDSSGSTLAGFAISQDGLNVYTSTLTDEKIAQYTLTTAWDMSTGSLTATQTLTDIASTATGLDISADGTKIYILDYLGANIDVFTMSTPYSIATASNTKSSYSVPLFSGIRGISFSEDGLVIAISESSNGTTKFGSLTTTFDLSTVSWNSTELNPSSQTGATVYGIDIRNTDKVYYVSSSNDTVYEYNGDFVSNILTLGTGSFASADVGKTIEANSGEFVLTATDGSYVETTAPTSYDQVASGDWGMYGVVYNATDGDLELSSYIDSTTYFDITTSSYTQSFSVSLQDTNPYNIAFNTDGTKMFVIGAANDTVYQYSLSTAFDLSTASYASKSFSVSGQEASPLGIAFNSDGTKMYIVGSSGDDVNEYSLSTAFDVSTASYSQNFSVSAQDSVPLAVAFNNDGTKMYVSGAAGQDINEYNLSTAFNVSTASFVTAFSTSSQDSSPSQIAFNADGTTMFVLGSATDTVYEYSLSTGFSIATASYSNNSFSVVTQTTNPSGLAISPNGDKMFVVDRSSDAIFEYSIGTTTSVTGYHPVHTTTSTDTTYWTDINSMTADQAAGDGNVYYAISTDDRTTWTVIDNTDGERDIVRNNGGTWQYNSNGTYALETWVNGTTNTELATLAEAMEGAEDAVGFVLANTTFVDSFNFSSEETGPNNAIFNSDGTKMFVTGQTGDDINEYNLSTAYDVSTATFVDSFSVAAKETNPMATRFNADGTKMFVVGTSSDSVHEYTLSTGFDISTATFSQSFSVASQTTYPTGLAFNTDGTKMFVNDGNTPAIEEYSLSTGFDISTASFTTSFSTSGQDSQPQGLTFNNDGTKMYHVGMTNDKVYEYTLTTGFDVSTASFTQDVSIASQDDIPRSVEFNSNGTNMYVVGISNTSVYEYTTSSVSYINQMDKTQLDAVTDPNHIALGNDLDLAIIFNMTSGSTVPSSDGVAINYDANVLNKGAVLGTDYDFDAPTSSSARITALTSGNFKVRVV